MTFIKRLGLTKLCLWSESERFQTYAQAMAKLTPGRAYTRQQIGIELFGLTYGGSKKPHRENVLTNVFGVIQIAPDKLLLRGINLFRRITPNGPHMVSGMMVWERLNDDWAPTEAALQLGEQYRRDPSGIRWQQILAEQLSGYEPRTRVLLYLLSHGYRLHFDLPGYFSGNAVEAQLVNNGLAYSLFGEKGAAFNKLLFEHREIAISHQWRDEIESAGYELDSNYELEGAMNRSPSTNKVGSALKTALFVFQSLGILVEQDGDWHVDPTAFARHVGAENSNELLGISYGAQPDLATEWSSLAHIMKALADEQGFVIVSEAAERWGELSDLPVGERLGAFNTLIRRGVFEGRIEIIDRHPGQPRMGHGLFDDDNMRMIKLRVLA